MSKYGCTVCGFIYDEKLGYPVEGIAPNTKWEDIPSSFICPLCEAYKEDFKLVDDSTTSTMKPTDKLVEPEEQLDYTNLELSAIFSNLSKGCEKIYNTELANLYKKLSLYYGKTDTPTNQLTLEDLRPIVEEDILNNFTLANELASKYHDRGTLRALKWSAQVSKLINSHLKKITLKTPKYLEDNNIYVCEICGFIHVGKEKPPVCPVCKVPNIKMTQIKRGA
jgi:rubredoxin